MPVKWDDKAMLDLFMVVLSVAGPAQFSTEQKNEIVQEMKNRGYDTVWNGIRYYFPNTICLLCFFFPSFLQTHFCLLFSTSLHSAPVSFLPIAANFATRFTAPLFLHSITCHHLLSTVTMSKWEGSMKDDLLQAFFNYTAPAAEQKQQIVAYLEQKGYAVTWDAIRYIFQSLPPPQTLADP